MFSMAAFINGARSNVFNHEKEWINLSANTPFKENDQFKERDLSPFMLLNETELVLVRYDWPIKDKISIFKYNVITMKWTNWCTCGLKRAEGDSFWTILSENKLYFFIKHSNNSLFSVMSLDLSSELSTNQLMKKIDRHRYTNYSVEWMRLRPIFVNGICHLFIKYKHEDCGDEQMMLLSLSEECGVVSEQHKFRNNGEDLFDADFCPIYVPNLNSILLFGQSAVDCMWRIRLDAKEKKWSEVKFKNSSLRMWFADAIIGSDGNYVLMSNAKNIFLLDVSDENDFKLFESDILTPMLYGRYQSFQSDHGCFAMGNGLKIEKLVVGWTKRLFGEKELKHLALPPLYLLQLISYWFLMEEIHWIGVVHNRLDHYAVPTKRILACTGEK